MMKRDVRDWLLIILGMSCAATDHFFGLFLALLCNITVINSLLKGDEDDKRYQDCSIIEKWWRNIHYIPVPFRWVWYNYFKPFNTVNDMTGEVERLEGVSLIPFIIAKIKRKFSKERQLPLKCPLWSVLVGDAQGRMKYYHTHEEVMEKFKKD